VASSSVADITTSNTLWHPVHQQIMICQGSVLDQTPREGHAGPAARARELAARLAHQSAPLSADSSLPPGGERRSINLRRIIWRPSASNNIAASFATARIAPARADFQQMYAGKYMRRGNGEADRALNRRTVNLRALELPGRETKDVNVIPVKSGARPVAGVLNLKLRLILRDRSTGQVLPIP
jgi:hypothetical protein